MASLDAQGPGRRAAYWGAIRPRTLLVSLAPVAVGTAVAATDGRAQFGLAGAALAGAVLLQIASNLANDVGDHLRGADGPDRVGPPRAAQQGLLSPRELGWATGAVLLAAAIPGALLIAAGGWPILVLGLVSMAAAVGYTAGPAYGYRGFGDLAVFLFFGIAAVVGTDFVQGGTLSGLAFAAAVPVGALATAILVINNLRDLDTDAAVGKRTLAVRLGRSGARAEWGGLVLLAYASPVGLWIGGRDAWVLLPLLTLPLAGRIAARVLRGAGGPELNDALAQNAQLTALFALLFAGGLVA